MSIHITALEAERFKRLKAVRLEPGAQGLTIIGGKNGQGKTSALDAIAFALGGAKFKPSSPDKRDGEGPAVVRVELSNGLVAERSGLKGSLKVTDPSGLKGSQGVLDEFIEQLALDLPKFLEANAKAKAETLLRIIGVGDKLEKFDAEEKDAYDKRRTAAKIADSAEKALDGMEKYPGVGEPVSIEDLRAELKEAHEAIARKAQLENNYHALVAQRESLVTRSVELRKSANVLDEEASDLCVQIDKDKAAWDAFRVPEVDGIVEREQAAVEIRRQQQANYAWTAAFEKAGDLKKEVIAAIKYLKAVREQRQKLLDSAKMPLKGLAIVDGELEYKGAKWDCMSSAEQLKVATAIVRKLSPECGFVLIDKLERMDLDSLSEFAVWADKEGLQIIATRVSTGEECSIVIEDGQVSE